jgi:hypothetical protein
VNALSGFLHHSQETPMKNAGARSVETAVTRIRCRIVTSLTLRIEDAVEQFGLDWLGSNVLAVAAKS